MRHVPLSARLLPSVLFLVVALAGSAPLEATTSGPPGGPPTSAAGTSLENRLIAELAAGLPVAEREIPYTAYAYAGVSQLEAELLFADAVAGVYLPELGEVILLVDPVLPPTSAPWAATTLLPPDEQPVPTPTATLGPATIDDFHAELGRRFPGLGAENAERFIVKMPTVVRRATRPAAAALLPPVSAQSSPTCRPIASACTSAGETTRARTITTFRSSTSSI